MLNQLNHVQASTTRPSLPALLKQPDFQEGMFWEDHEKAWTEDEIIAFIGEELSEERYRHEQHIDQVMGYSSLSYLHHLGFTISYLDQALAARAQ